MASLWISHSGIVLRGAGPEKTFILNTATAMRAKRIIAVEAPAEAQWRNREEPLTLLADELPGPTVFIPVESTEGFAVGDYVIIRSDPTTEWVLERGETDWVGWEDRIGSILYLRRIEAIDTRAGVLLVDIPTRYALNTRERPEVYRKTGQLREVGVEGFSIGNVEHPGRSGWGALDFAVPDSEYTRRLIESYGVDENFADAHKSAQDVHFSFAITMMNVTDGWIRNVNSFAWEENELGSHLLSNGIRLRECRNVTVENCHFQKPQYGGGGGNGYMFRLDHTNECLLVDCSASSSRHGFSLSGMATSGNVHLRCRDSLTGRQTGGTGLEETGGKATDSHMFFSHSNLYDSCVAEDSWFEARYRYSPRLSNPKHNTTSAHTVFWNTKGISNTRHPFVVWSDQGDYGYVIGTSGAVPGVRLDGDYPERAHVTAPVDFVEGIGEGETLEPASLYEDQLQRRLSAGG